MLSVLNPQESLFRDVVQSVFSVGSSNEVECFLRIVKHFSTLGNKFVTESILEKSI